MHAIPGLLMAKHECCLSMNSEAKLKKIHNISLFVCTLECEGEGWPFLARKMTSGVGREIWGNLFRA
jgi:hypothetical protein